VTVRDVRTGAESRLPCGGLWIAVGRAPATDAVAGAVPLDEDGYVRRPEGWSTATAVPGIFAAGECTDRVYRQAITAAAMGCMAAHDAIRWLATSKGHDVERT
jgi:thioredoxin reductase (NADPH)